jgi:hypothetical protein
VVRGASHGSLSYGRMDGRVTCTQVLRISYMDAKHEADLNADGFIYYRGDKFSSPSAWSIHVKRLANPSKKADDGWKSVRYVPSGKTLEHYKSQVRMALLCASRPRRQ